MNFITQTMNAAHHYLFGVTNFNGHGLKASAGWLGLAKLAALLLAGGLLISATTLTPATSSAQRGASEPQAIGRVGATDSLNVMLATSLPAPLSAIQAGGGCGASFMQPASSPVGTGSNPQSIVMGDFNLDHKPDLAVGNRNSGNVTILLGNSNGGFSQPAGSPLSVGGDPSAVAVGDFNLDGKPDLAVASSYLISPGVRILLGNGSGGFSQVGGSLVGSGSDPQSVAVGDFNLDGRPDLAVGTTGSNNVTILLGNGNGGFTQTGSPVNIGNKAFALVVGDFNLDGKPDLAAANSFISENVMILLGNGSGGFSPAPGSPISVGADPLALAIGDFNLDGKPDLAVANLLSDNVMILLGNGSGGFSQAAGSPVNAGLRPRSVAVGDFNLDGHPDLATANMVFPGTVTILLGNGSGSFSQVAGSPISAGNGHVSLVVSDLNLDGKPDLAVANNDSNSVSILLNTCSAIATPLTLTIQDPAACTGPGNVVKVTLTITNTAGAAQNVTATATPAPQLFALPNTCVASVGNCTVAGTVNYSATLAAGQTATITYQAQVADNTPPGASLCITSAASFNNGAPMTVQACTTVNCPVVGPGNLPLAASPVSAQKAGSVLVYNLYDSSAANASAQNTRLNITNTHSVLSTAVHLFFVDGASCSVADSFICLTPNQTASFLASDADPDTKGYVVAVATDFSGCPRDFNYLIGDEYVKLSSGHAANLGTEAFAALAGGLPFCDANSATAVLNFDGVSYNMAPRVLALSNVPSRADGNDTLLVLNRFGGNLATSAATLGAIFGLLYDDAEQGLSFTVNGSCQLRGSLSGNFIRTAPRFETFIPAGRSGWLKFYSQNDLGILGAAINFNGNAGTQSSAFNQGHNLHKLRLTPAVVLTIPVFPPNC